LVAEYSRPPIVTLEFLFVDTNSRALAIDKTGTITEGCPRVMRCANAAWEKTSDAPGTIADLNLHQSKFVFAKSMISSPRKLRPENSLADQRLIEMPRN
jgi:cation transport ATPase